MEYTFTITESSSGNDRVDLTVRDEAITDMTSMTEVTGITDISHALSGLDPSTLYSVYVQAVRGDRVSAWSKMSFTTLPEGELYLYDDQDNSPVLAGIVGQKMNVTLVDRTLYKDGSWNTLCLPFAVTDGDPVAGDPDYKGGIDRTTFTGTPLEGAEVKYFDHASFESATGTLEIVFYDTYTVHAGEPVLVRWTNAGSSGTADLVNPVFTGVTINAQTPQTVDHEGSAAALVGTYSPVEFTTDDRSVLYLGGDNTLYYPNGEGTTTIGSQRASFQLNNGITAGGPENSGNIRILKLNFGEDGETQGITATDYTKSNDEWYTIDGRKLKGAGAGSVPARLRKGLYINNGRKVVVGGKP